MAAAVNPLEVEAVADALRASMRQDIRIIADTINGSLQRELHIDRNLFVEPIANLIRMKFMDGVQSLTIAQKVSTLIKRMAADRNYDPSITNLFATSVATVIGTRIKLMEFKDDVEDEVEEHINAIQNPQPNVEPPNSAVTRAMLADRPPFDQATYLNDLDTVIAEIIEIVKRETSNKASQVREISLQTLITSIERSITARFDAEVKINEFLPDLLRLITQILGHVFSDEGPFIIENLRRIAVLSVTHPFAANKENQSGVIKFTGQPQEFLWLSADNLEDLNQYKDMTLEAINAYAYWKLLLYAPEQAWQEIEWMKNLVLDIPDHWWENPSVRFDMFIHAWILDTLSRVNLLVSTQTLKQKIAQWKIQYDSKKIIIEGPLLDEILNFDTFFKIDYQSIFHRDLPRGKINPFLFITDAEIQDRYINQHHYEGIMIDCAKQALCVHTREVNAVRRNRLRTYNGIGVGDPIISNKRVDLRGLRFFLDFVDTKFLTPTLERTSIDLFALTMDMGTFINYVSVYAFNNGFPPEGRRVLQWTADRSPTMRNYPSLLRYLEELRARVENVQPLCDTTPNVYLDIPVVEAEVPALGGGSAAAVGSAAVGSGGSGGASASAPDSASRHVAFAPPSPSPPPSVAPNPVPPARPPPAPPARPPPASTPTLALARPPSAMSVAVGATRAIDAALATARPAPTGLALGGFSKLARNTTPLLSRPQPVPQPQPQPQPQPAPQPSPQQRRPAGSDPGGLSVAGDPAQGLPVFSAGVRTGLRSELVSRGTADINTLLAEYRELQRLAQDNPTDNFRDALARARLAYAAARRAYESAGRDVSAYPDPGRAS